MIKLCAFADEADNSLLGQIEALKRNGISYIELRNLDGKNACDLTDEEGEKLAYLTQEAPFLLPFEQVCRLHKLHLLT